MELAEEIWKRLTEDMLLQILARLPLKIIFRFRAVSKTWKQMFESLEFKRLVSTLAVSSTDAFLVVQGRDSWNHSHLPFVENMWISTEGTYNFHRLSLDFLPSPVYVVASCTSLLFCCGIHLELYICNPMIRTWIKIPDRPNRREWDFVALAFDKCTTYCTLIIGRYSGAENRRPVINNLNSPENEKGVEIYDSKTNKWTQFEMTVDGMVRPKGEGIYSNGIFYWVNEVYDGDCYSLVTFHVEQRKWRTIKGPQDLQVNMRGNIHSERLHVTSLKGRIVFLSGKEISLWELISDEVNGEKWSPKKDLDENLDEDLDENNVLESLDCQQLVGCLMFNVDVAVNDSGCVLAFLPMTRTRITIWNNDRKILQQFLFAELVGFSEHWASARWPSARAYQVNNIWWP